jgi:hypothetical protein
MSGDCSVRPMWWIHTPSAHSNSVAMVFVFGIPNCSDGVGFSTRRQCMAIGHSAPCTRLVCAGPALPVRSRTINRATIPAAALYTAAQLPIGTRKYTGPSR